MSLNSPYLVQCPACESGPSQLCTTVVGYRSEAHPARWEKIGVDVPGWDDRKRAWDEAAQIRAAGKPWVR